MRCPSMNENNLALAILRQHRAHPRHWRENFYVYPVISRRSGGLSIGINLNPDTACNFDCIYCQVDRTVTPRVRDVDPARLREELTDMIAAVHDGSIWTDPAFADVPAVQRVIRDLAFSGDGEPTTCPIFSDCVQIAAEVKGEAGLAKAKVVLITDACYLTKPDVLKGLAIMDANQGEIWAKLDAGTEEYYREVNRPNFPLRHVIEQIAATARDRPVVIQSLFMRVHGLPPDEAEIIAFTVRLNEVLKGGGRIDHVQVYTVARPPAQNYVSALSRDEVDRIAGTIAKWTGLAIEPYYG